MSTWLNKIAPFASTVLEPILGGVFHKYGTVATTAVRSAVTLADNGVEKLVAVYQKWDESHPFVQTATAEAQKLLQLAGMNAPTAEQLAVHIRAAIHDLATAFVPLDGGATAPAASSANTTQQG